MHVGTADDRTQWRDDVMREGRATAVQIEGISCSETIIWPTESSVLSVEIETLKFLVANLMQDLN